MALFDVPGLAPARTLQLRCRPASVRFNCDSTRFSVIDGGFVLSFYDLEARAADAGAAPSAAAAALLAAPALGAHLPFERRDVWQIVWADDSPELAAVMEKTRMYIFRGVEPEEPISRCVFSFPLARQPLSAADGAPPAPPPLLSLISPPPLAPRRPQPRLPVPLRRPHDDVGAAGRRAGVPRAARPRRQRAAARGAVAARLAHAAVALGGAARLRAVCRGQRAPAAVAPARRNGAGQARPRHGRNRLYRLPGLRRALSQRARSPRARPPPQPRRAPGRSSVHARPFRACATLHPPSFLPHNRAANS